jgi:magnesium transporter
MTERLSTEELRDVWRILDPGERLDGFRLVAHDEGEEFFVSLSTADQLELVESMRLAEQRLWARTLAPDDAADLIQEADDDRRAVLMTLFDELTRREVRMLLAYAEDDAGGLMSPRYARVRPEMTVDEAILYLRRQANLNLETIYYGYVLEGPVLLGVVSFRDLFQAKGDARVSEIMHADLITVQDDTDQEAVGAIMAEADLVAVPVVDSDGHMKGIVTIDDIVDVVQEEATEDIQKIGGTEALEAPYLEVGFLGMLRKRGGWLTILFLAQLFSITVMTFYQESIARMAVLASFIPLIISSGGNSGSQATTLVTRAMALKEVRLRDWMRVFSMEVVLGLALGLILALIGFARILWWPGSGTAFGEHYVELGLTVATSVLCVVVWGTVSGSMLPLLLRRLGFDPASASAPLVATLVDIIGLVIYFNVARFWLAGAGL